MDTGNGHWRNGEDMEDERLNKWGREQRNGKDKKDKKTGGKKHEKQETSNLYRG